MTSYKDSVKLISSLREKLKDKIDISHFGATISPKGKSLSKGCYSCKTGSWICVYMGFSCNLNCKFCSREYINDSDKIFVHGGDGKISSIEQLKENIDKDNRISGVAFSGGEPFLYLDKINEWLEFISKEYPDLYLWIYTNGTKVTKEDCLKLKDNGIQEIRFDLAATNYDYNIIRKIEYCKKIFNKVCVEVPSLPWQFNRIIDALPILNDVGLDYLNLHEIQINFINQDKLIDEGIDINKSYKYPLHSIKGTLDTINNTYKIINYIENNKLNIIYNDCGAMNKSLQALGFNYQKKVQEDPLYNEKWEDYLCRLRAEEIIGSKTTRLL